MRELADEIKKNPELVAEFLEAIVLSYEPGTKTPEFVGKDLGTINGGIVNAIKGFFKGTKPKKLFVVRYEHRYGVDVWLVRAESKPTQKQIIKKFRLDFEEDAEEYLYCAEAGNIEEI